MLNTLVKPMRALRWFACLALLLLGPLLAPAQTDKQAWVQRYNGPAESEERAQKVVVDFAGNVVVVGYTDDGDTGPDMLVIKYSYSGAVLWRNRYNGPINGEDFATAVAVDSGGNVFVTGNSEGIGSARDFATIAYSSGGYPLWTNRYTGPGSRQDLATAVAAGIDGNVFVAGNSFSVNSGDRITIAYSSGGAPLWTNRFNGPTTGQASAIAMAVGSDGNIYVTGDGNASIRDYVTIAYSSTGIPLWTNRYNGLNNSSDTASALVVSANGNVFVTGSSGLSYATVAYSSGGTPLWTNRYNGAGDSIDFASAMAVDPSGKVFVTGRSFGSGFGPAAYTTIAYSEAGAVLWTNIYTGLENGSEATAVTVNSSNVFVTGRSYGNSLFYFEWATVAYSTTGMALWTNRYNGYGTGDAVANSLAADASGKVFVTGYSRGATLTDDFTTIAYSSAGLALWTNRFDGPGNKDDIVDAAAADTAGNVFVTGRTFVNGNSSEWLTLAYSKSGVALWTNRYDGPGNGYDAPKAAAVDSFGRVFVTGAGYNGSNSFDFLTIAYTGAGLPLWTNLYVGTGEGWGSGDAIAVDKSGNVFVTGSSIASSSDFAIVAYSGAGVPLWTNRYDGPGNSDDGPVAIAVDSSGNVFVTGSARRMEVTTDWATIAYSGAGVPLWTNRYGSSNDLGNYPTAIAVGSDDKVFVAGTFQSDFGSPDLAVIAYSSGGTPLWTNRYSGGGAADMAVDQNGKVFVTGSLNGIGGSSDLITIAFSTSGLPLWTNQFNGPGNSEDFANALVVDGNGNVFVTGISGYAPFFDCVTIAYANDGTALWTNRYNRPANGYAALRSLVASDTGSVVAAGFSGSRAMDYTVVKYVSGFSLGISDGPASRINMLGTTATFSVGVTGTAPFSYQWRRNGTNLLNGGSVSGVTTSNVTLSAVSTNDPANYTVVVANPAGSVTSVVAVLSVVQASTPQVLLNGVAYPANVVVTPSSAAFTAELQGGFPAGDFLYTTDGSDPIGGELYEGPFQVSPPFSIRVLAISADFLMAAESAVLNSLVVTTPGGGTAASNPQRDVVTGGPVVLLTAEPAAGWSFMNWSGDAGGASRTISVAVDQPKSVQAVFGTPLNATINGGGQISTTPGGPFYAFGAKVRLTGLPNSGSYFTRWLGAVKSTNNPVDLGVTNASPSLLAIFAVLPTNTFALTVSITGEGSVSRTPYANFYTNGTVVTLTAVPGALQNFTAWSGDVASLSNSISITMNANKFLTATFDTVTPSPVPVFFLASPTYSISESGANVTVTVLKRINSPGGTVNYATTNGTALSPGDYAATSGALTFSSNEVSKTVSISIVDNAGYIGTRQFSFILSLTDTNSALGSPSNAIVTIIEDDLPITTNSLLTQIPPGPRAANTSGLSVELHPAGVGQWALEQESTWHNSEEVLGQLSAGTYTLKFRRVPGYTPPENVVVPVDADGTNYFLFGYAPITTPPVYGSVQVMISPSDTANNVNSLLRGLWRLRSHTDTNWRSSGETVTGVLAGTNVVEFYPVRFSVTPQPREVVVGASQVSVVPGVYRTYGFSGAAAVPRTSAEATNTAFGMGFVGQVLSEAGSGSGFVVKPRVVLTAAHVVFNDQAFSFVSPPQWLFQRHEGIYEPAPLTARGFYVLAGYASARTNDPPGVSSLTSHSLDVAAIFFNDDAGRGGASGYLVSETPPAGTEWLMQLTAPGQSKFLLGYPVETPDQALTPGRLYATPLLSEPVGFGIEEGRVFSTIDLHGYPGMSGGPLCVPFTNGVYYPAAVFLGGTGQRTVVRAIDGVVASLIEQAEKSAYTGDNFTGGGVLRIVPSQSISSARPGYISWEMTPVAAARAGAGWRVQGGSTEYSTLPNQVVSITSTNAISIEFKSLPGWNLPSNQSVSVLPALQTRYTAFYTVTNPVMMETRALGISKLGMTGTTGTVYRLERKSALTNANWLTVSTNTIRTNGFNPVLTNPAPGFYRLNWLTNF